MPVITLTTDFGAGDQEAGVLKGVIWSIAPQAQIADLSHEIPDYDILAGALLLWRATPYFPAGTIHVAVVDPGVGTSRRAIAAQIGNQYFVGPDNGLFTLVLERAVKNGWRADLVQLDNPRYWLGQVTQVFHGRDIFSPIAAHLANGIPLHQLGSPLTDPVRLSLPQPVRTATGWQAHIIHIDHFGNLATDIHADQLGAPRNLVIRVGDQEIRNISQTFGDSPSGELIAMLDSSGSLAICVVNGSAAERLQAQTNDLVEIILSSAGV